MDHRGETNVTGEWGGRGGVNSVKWERSVWGYEWAGSEIEVLAGREHLGLHFFLSFLNE